MAATWAQPPRWWRENATTGPEEAWHYGALSDGFLVVEAHCEVGKWFLDRILD